VSDASGRPDPVEDFKVIMGELAKFGAGLDEKPMIVAASKCDVANPDKLESLRKFVDRKKLEFYEISAVTGEGIKELEWAMARYVEEVRRRLAAGETVVGPWLFTDEFEEPKAAAAPLGSRSAGNWQINKAATTSSKKRENMATKKAAKKATKKATKAPAKKTAKKAAKPAAKKTVKKAAKKAAAKK
jgi:hypothetical protein